MEQGSCLLAILPICALLLLVLICRTREPLWRRAVLLAAMAWGVLVTVITEILSLFHALMTAGVAVLWGLVIVGLAVRYRSHLRTLVSNLNVERRTSNAAGDLPPSSVLMLMGVGLFMGVTAVVALVAPPNTWDSMTYHMSRVMHWIQNQSVDYYPSHTSRQLHRSPWAGYAILQFQLLHHSDRFANLVQWVAMIGSVMVLTLIAKLLGADARGQILTAVVATSLPIGILEASSTQTDFAAALWLICFVTLVLEAVLDQHVRSSPLHAVELGAAFGLAVLTKATNYLYVTPFLLWWIITGLRRHGAGVLPRVALVATIVLVLNLGPYARNLDLYGSPLGPGTDEPCNTCGLTTETLNPGLIFSNFVRHVGRHLGTPFEPVNLAIEGAIYHLHTLLGIPANEPRVTWRHYLFAVTPPVYSEDMDGNPFHLALLVLAIIGIVIPPGRRSLLPYTVALAGGFLLLCAFIKWNPFVSRLHLPFFLLGAPVSAMALAQVRSGKVFGLSLVLLFALALPYVLFNDYRPLIVKQYHYERLPLYAGPIDKPDIVHGTRARLYFSNWPELADHFHGAVKGLKGRRCFKIGLLKGWDDWEYPFWPLLAEGEPEHVRREIRVEHMAVANQSSRLASREPFSHFTPCAVVKIDGQALTVRFMNSDE